MFIFYHLHRLSFRNNISLIRFLVVSVMSYASSLFKLFYYILEGKLRMIVDIDISLGENFSL